MLHCHLRTEQMDGPEPCRQRLRRLGRAARAEFDVINHHNLLQFPKTNVTGWNDSAVPSSPVQER